MTSFDDVFQFYLGRITTYQLLKLTDDEKYEDLILKLKMAMARFTNIQNITVDYTNKTFSRELSPNEIDIITNLMICEWLNPLVLSEETLKNRLKSKDYEIYSPANLLSQLIEIRRVCQREASRLINQYGFTSNYINKKKSDINGTI